MDYLDNQCKTSNCFRVCDGIFATIQKIVCVRNNMAEYNITLQREGVDYCVRVSETDLYRTKFLRNIPFGDMGEPELYKQIRRQIADIRFTDEDIRYRTDQNGLQKVNEEWMFVFSNGGIYDAGFTQRVYSGIEGYYIPSEAMVDSEEVKGIIKSLFRELNHNPKVFYPLFLLNIMAITNGYLRLLGEKQFMKITLWLAGASGSGKTELAKAVGTYVFADSDLNCNAVSATARRNYVLENLGHSSGCVFFFDDVKQETVRERKNSVKNKVDDILRSVFNGRLTDVVSGQSTPPLIDACALITGEFMQTEESQNARLLYLNADGFLKHERNSETLRILQQNPLWITTVCCDYICWLLTKVESDIFRSFVKSMMDEVRGEKKGYGGINNAARLNENRHMIEMVCILLERYLREGGLTEEFIGRFKRAAELSIESLCSNTFALLGGEEMIIQKAVSDLLKTCHIRKARFQLNPRYSDSGFKYRQDYFMLQSDDDILLIDDYEESLVKNTQGQHDQYDIKPCLIIREEKLINLLNESIREVLREYPVTCIFADEIISHLSRLLKKMQLIYKQRRSDGNWGRTAVKYPVCEVKEEWDKKYYEGEKEMETRCIVDYKPTVQLNAEHPYLDFLMERFEDAESEKILRGVELICDTDGKKLEESEIYKLRKAFMNSKTLYKE